MPFSSLPATALARALAQVGDRPHDLVDAYFERLELIELPPDDESMGLRARREEGLAVRLVRDGQTWLASRDRVDAEAFTGALRQVARVLPAAAYPDPALRLEPLADPPEAPELLAFPGAVQRAIRERLVAFPVRLTVRLHRRDLQVIGPRLVAEAESERYYSIVAELENGRWGTLLPALGDEAADAVAERLVALFRSRQAASPAAGRLPVVLGPSATAVLLHEAVSHALEADVLAAGGRAEGAIGVRLGPSRLTVLDDPASSPGDTARTTDDEGSAVCRRWLLRSGVVEQPLADSLWAGRSDALVPGAARRGSRHLPPAPRSSHLELLPGEESLADLIAGAEEGLYVAEVARGRLDPLSGRFRLEIACARRIRGGVVADPVGRLRLAGSVAGLLEGIVGVGSDARPGGAGWCAKDGQKIPVWATAPAIRVQGLEVVP